LPAQEQRHWKGPAIAAQSRLLEPVTTLLSGWDMLTLLKSDAATRQIPVIVTATRAEKEQAFSNQADDFEFASAGRFCNRFWHVCATDSQSGKGVAQSTHTH